MRVFEFLAGLNRDLDDVRGRILGRRPLPSTRDVFAEVRREEARQKVMLKEAFPAEPEISALLSRGSSHGCSPNFQRHELRAIIARNQGTLRDNFWFIHGKPAGWKPKQNAKARGYQAIADHQTEKH